MLSIIVAMDQNNLIGSDGQIPWHLSKDMKYFKEKTLNKPVLMGRKTYESFPEKVRPLPNRTNIVITHNANYKLDKAHVFYNLNDGLVFAKSLNQPEIMILGGGQIYNDTIELCDRLYITKIEASYTGNTYFPNINYFEWNYVSKIDSSENGINFSWIIYDRKAKI